MNLDSANLNYPLLVVLGLNIFLPWAYIEVAVKLAGLLLCYETGHFIVMKCSVVQARVAVSRPDCACNSAITQKCMQCNSALAQ